MSGYGDADLALLEVNTASPIVRKLIEQIRSLQDEIVHRDIEIEQLKDELERQ